MAKIIVYLGEQERTALQQLAQRGMRVPRAQAALIIREELVRQGMIPIQNNPQGQDQGAILEMASGAQP
jgi:hypothetical protein